MKCVLARRECCAVILTHTCVTMLNMVKGIPAISLKWPLLLWTWNIENFFLFLLNFKIKCLISQDSEGSGLCPQWLYWVTQIFQKLFVLMFLLHLWSFGRVYADTNALFAFFKVQFDEKQYLVWIFPFTFVVNYLDAGKYNLVPLGDYYKQNHSAVYFQWV